APYMWISSTNADSSPSRSRWTSFWSWDSVIWRRYGLREAGWDTRSVAAPKNPDEALALMMEGNRRHRDGRIELRDHSPVDDRAANQTPFAAIIGCADSRVSPTLIFDVGPGN